MLHLPSVAFLAAATTTLLLSPVQSYLHPRSHVQGSNYQAVLQQPDVSFSSGSSLNGGGGDLKYTLREQNDSICNAGVKQWTGLVDVSEEKKLFFWFFESRHRPSEDPVIIWLNGGPGGPSMLGLFTEIGPCLVPDSQPPTTEYNPHSWSNFANVIFIDQPAGVGFSSVNNGSTGGPSTLREAAVDFEKLLFTIFNKMLPQYSHLPLHISGESFGGKYVPFYVHYMHTRQKMEARNALQIPIQSIILVDAVIDGVGSTVGGLYDHLCSRDLDGNIKSGGLNETACTAMEQDTPACERLGAACLESYDLNVCTYADEFCSATVGKWYGSEIIPGGRDPYDDRKKCGDNPPICEGFANGPFTKYLNLPGVQEALGIENRNFSGINMDLNDRFQASGDVYRPTTRETSYILDETDMKVLVLNGNNDIIVNTEGQIRVWDALPWSKQAQFRLQTFGDWFWPTKEGTASAFQLEKGGQLKRAGKLTFVTVDNAGHTSPGDAPESVAFVVECWVSGKSRTGVECP